MNFENVKRIWKQHEKGFTIELVNWRHQIDDQEKWNIYVYVYPTHKWYQNNIDMLKNGAYYDLDQSSSPPFHGGITRCEIHPQSIEIGCDYQHLGDEFYAIESDPHTFEYDINLLINWFNDYNSNGQDIADPVPTPSIKDGHGLNLEELYQSHCEVC